MELPRTRKRVGEGVRGHEVQKLRVENDPVTRAKLRATVDLRKADRLFRSSTQPITNIPNILWKYITESNFYHRTVQNLQNQ
jgi:hypothetical protein